MASSGNFCTFNPLPYSTNFRTGLSNVYNGVTGAGNTQSNPGNNCTGFGTMALTSGKKWYMEGIATNAFTTAMGIFELNDANLIQNNLNTTYHTNTSYKSAFYAANGKKYIDGTESSYGATFVAGDVIGMAVDLESGTNTITFYKNNASQGSFNLGTNGLDYLFCIARPSSSGGFHMNWGQDSTFAGTKTAGGNADDSGFGDFFYAVPSGHLALCSGNLGISDDIDPAQTDDDYTSKQFNCIAYTGTGSSNAVTGLGFRPDLVVIKNRSGTQGTKWTDSSRGVTKVLQSATTSAESTDTNGLTAFGSDGFTVGSDAGYNGSSNNIIAWCWRANGGVTSSNTDGATTTTVQANTKAGFSIVEWPQYTPNSTFGHGLSKAPTFIISKLTGLANWALYHTGLDSGKVLYFTNSAQFTSSIYNSTAPTSSVFSLGASYAGSGAGISYCWHDVEGFQKFGKYTANGNADGPFVYTGFRPRLLVIKGIDTTNSYMVFDTARETANPIDKNLHWDASAAEATEDYRDLDILSNGFKIRSDNGALGHPSGDEYIYMAWGDVPFKYNNTF